MSDSGKSTDEIKLETLMIQQGAIEKLRVLISSVTEVLKTISVSCRDRCVDELPACDCCRCAAKRVLRAILASGEGKEKGV